MMCDVNSGNGGLYRIDGDGVLKWETLVCQKMCTGQGTSNWTRDPQG